MYRKKDLAEIANAWNQIKAEEKNPKSWSLLAEILLEAGDEEGAERTHNAYLEILDLQIEELPNDLTLRKLSLEYSTEAFGKRDSRVISAKKEYTRVSEYLERLANPPGFDPKNSDEWKRVQIQNGEKSILRFILFAAGLLGIGFSIWGASIVVFFCSLCGTFLLTGIFGGPSESELRKVIEQEREKYEAFLHNNSMLLQEIHEARKNLAPRRYIDEESLRSPMPPFLAYTQ